MRLTYFGHSCFQVEVKGKTILFDPFITPNELASKVDIQALNPDYIFLSHAHEDHFADCISIATRTGCTVVAAWEIHFWLNKNGISNTHPMNTGGKWKFDFGTVKCVVAHHSSSLPDGSYGGNPMGFIFSTEEGNFYYAGDTALTFDMELIPRWASLDLAILPIGDNFTMDIEDAIIAAEMVECNRVMGVHYDTFGFIKINKEEAIAKFDESGVVLLLPGINETIEF